MILSVVMITYGHENYIRESIYSILMQKCEFEVELIISNDCSPDSTHDIILDIISSHPNKHWIKYTRQNHNLGPARNSIWALNEARGKYVALCEGDDYWTDSYKLQRQVDFLENNPIYSFCFHPVTVKNETINGNYSYPTPSTNTLKFSHVLFRHYIPTCSVVFRNGLLPRPLPKWLENSKMCDIPIELLLVDKGYAYYINHIMGVYRLNNTGITQNKQHIKNARRAYAYLYRSLQKHFGNKYYLLFSIMIIKNKIGYIKDLIGLNPYLKN